MPSDGVIIAVDDQYASFALQADKKLQAQADRLVCRACTTRSAA
jgi:hypothetical protein